MEPTESSFFRSELMSRCQLYLPPEAAYNCVSELGELGLVQFVDLNPDVSNFQRQFVGEVKRCEELERKLRFIEREIIREHITVAVADGTAIPAPAPREMVELETSLANIETNLTEVNTNFVALRKNHLELNELKSMLNKTESFLDQHNLNVAGDGAQPDESTRLLEEPDQSVDLEEGKDGVSSMRFNITAGVIDRSRMISFERMLWRVSKGNVFVKFADIDEAMEDPRSGETLYKVVFVIIFQGEELKGRVKKICEGFHASVYPCPQSPSERREMKIGVSSRLDDLHTILTQTEDHRRRLLQAASVTLQANYVKVRKMKAVYHILNLFSLRDAQRVLIGECWMPTGDIGKISDAIKTGTDQAGSTVPPTIERVPTTEEHPTFNRTNKYTGAFQSLIDNYGVNSYREVNPSAYTIATFPFLFAVMFGDAGHGLIMFFFALWMVLAEEKLEKKKGNNEIFDIFFGGRYIVLLMGIFSTYTGLMYNDVFSKSLNIFGSHWSAENFTFVASNSTPFQLGKTSMLDPSDRSMYTGRAYPFGVDPVWQSATNKIGFLNTYKMKISLIFGVIHMSCGVLVSLWNKISQKKYNEIILEFIPQIVFLLFIFGYLIVMIFIKWVLYGASATPMDPYSEHCAPNLLITFINMMLFKAAEHDPKMSSCVDPTSGFFTEIYMYPNQLLIQKVLVITGVLMVPIMLFGKPLYTLYKRKQLRQAYDQLQDELLESAADEHEEDGFGELMIHQGIHTIEYVLGSVSHTASYLRLWALSLAHAQLSEVLWSMVMRIALGTQGYLGAVMIYVIFSFWAALTISILVLMEGLSAFLHTLRLHWVEFQSKFYAGAGYLFAPFSFRIVLREAAADDKEVLKAIG